MTTINKTDGSILAIVADGTANTSASDLTLVGKQYLNYGEPITENFVKLLENFKNTTAPANPIEGQLWYDSANQKLKVYRTTGFVEVGKIISGNTEPSNSTVGDGWFDTGNDMFKIYNGSDWISVGPYSSAFSDLTGKPTTISGYGITDAITKASVPMSSTGQAGDVEGLVALDSDYIYYCTAAYDGSTNIWKRVAWSADTW
jgi:hypothetical protein